MARAYTKCADCGDILWFENLSCIPQGVICPCGNTELTEDGPLGSYTDLSQEEIDGVADL